MSHGFYKRAAPELPHPPIHLSVLLVVEEALRTAWSILKQGRRPGFDLATALEDPITHELYEVLYDEVFGTGIVAGFDRMLFTVVTRESNLRNYDGSSLDKQPDLLVGLIDRPSAVKRSQDWLFIECKPVDRDHPAGGDYCDKGLIRFVKGEYAWAMTEAMMVGYAREPYTISSKLHTALEERRATIPTHSFPVPCPCSEAVPHSERVQASTHGRRFKYVGTGRQAPHITIRHLWLRRD